MIMLGFKGLNYTANTGCDLKKLMKQSCSGRESLPGDTYETNGDKKVHFNSSSQVCSTSFNSLGLTVSLRQTIFIKFLVHSQLAVLFILKVTRENLLSQLLSQLVVLYILKVTRKNCLVNCLVN